MPGSAALKSARLPLERALAALAAGDFPAAADHCLTALARDGTCADAWRSLGHAARQTGEGDAAREAYLRGLVLRPEDPEGWFSLATLLTCQHRFDQAIHAFRTAVRQDPARIDAWTNIALLRFCKGHTMMRWAILAPCWGRTRTIRARC